MTIDIAVHPNVYKTRIDSHVSGLLSALETIWCKEDMMGLGTFYLISGFANYNGGVRFYDLFEKHISKGGKVKAYFGGSTSQRLTSKQVVRELLERRVDVKIINRKRLFHLKCYGVAGSHNSLVVSSGNFTAPGMSQNVEMSVVLRDESFKKSGFSWTELLDSFDQQSWEIYAPPLKDLTHPAWNLLYDEIDGKQFIAEEPQVSAMILTLGHADTARINAISGTDAAKGTQYFWLSKDCYDFFQPLLLPNQRGTKRTYSCEIELNYCNLNIIDTVRVTFEAENNLDFRLGTGKLKGTNIVQEGDIAVLSRVAEKQYELRLFRKSDHQYQNLLSYAINYIGHLGKKYGYIPLEKLSDILGAE